MKMEIINSGYILHPLPGMASVFLSVSFSPLNHTHTYSSSSVLPISSHIVLYESLTVIILSSAVLRITAVMN